MKKGIETLITVFLLVFAGFIGFIIFESEFVSAAGATIYVDDDNTGSPTMDGSMLDPYDTIQKGIDNTTDGDTVFVFNGTYIENVIVDKSIDLTGEGKNNTAIDGSGIGDVVQVTNNSVNITGFTVTGGGFSLGDAGIELNNVQNCMVIDNNISLNMGHGMYLNTSSNNNITTNNISNNEDGIYLQLSTNNNITANNISNNEEGVYLWTSLNNNITNNNITSNVGDGIQISASWDNNITGNTITMNDGWGIHLVASQNMNITNNDFFFDGVFITGFQLVHFNTHTIPDTNTVNGEKLYYHKDENNIDIDGIPVGQLILANCTDFQVKNLEINNTDLGIEIAHSMNNTMRSNNISWNNEYGIYLISSSNNNLTDNNITNNNYGIYLDSSSYNNITDNNVSNYMDGIYIVVSTNNNIINNNVTNNGYSGINLSVSSDYNDLDFNNISLNGQHGIRLISCTNNNITENNISWNTESGIRLESATDNTVTNNNASENFDGIYLELSDYNNVTDNDVFLNFDEGIQLDDSSYCNITDNDVYSNVDDGMLLYPASDCNVTDNNIWDNDMGMYIRSASNINITNNNVSWNWNAGMYIRSASDMNVSGNNVSWNRGDGIYLRSASDINVTDNNVSWNWDDGIYLRAADGNTITGNNISNNSGDGLYIWFSDDNNYIGNNVSDNGVYGFEITSSMGNNLTYNSMRENGIFIFGNALTQWNTHSINTSNTVNGKPVYYWKNQAGGTIPPGAGEVILVNCTDITIENQDLTNCSVGIEIGYSLNINITGNNEANNIYGFYIYVSDGNTITDNNVSNNSVRGIYLGYSDGNIVKDNNVSYNDLGIFVRWSDGNNISENNAINNSNGIYLFSSDWNNVTSNNISLNYDYGINLWDSYWNKIIDNNVSDNENGIFLGSSSDNSIYHNNIINNINQSFDDTNDANQWDNGYPSGGNYWSNWSPVTPDLFSGAATPQVTGSPDGICDNQYDIDAYNTDFYPLKNPWDPNNTPPAPSILIATPYIYCINISWTEPTLDGGFPVTNYTIYRGETPGGETYLATIGNLTFYNDTAVSNWITYYYRVSATNILGEGPLSNEDSAMPLSEPNAPTGLATIFGDTYVNLTWNAPSLDGGFPISHYNIYRNGTSGVYTTVPAGQRWFEDLSVINGITYTYNVSANNSIGEGPQSEDVSETPMTTPSAPLNLQANAGDENVYISWFSPSDEGGSPVTEYHIYRNGTPGIYASVPETQPWYTDLNVINGLTYTYNVTAVNIVGEGPNVTVSATPMTIPSVPQNPQADAGDGYVHLTWEEPADDGGSSITDYYIHRNGTPVVYAFVAAPQLWYFDIAAVNGITYTYNISAKNDAGEGPKTTGVSETPMAPPTAPEILWVDSGNTYVNLTWTAPSDNGGFPITGYNIYRNGTTGIYLSVLDTPLWFNDTDVVNGIRYTYDISAINIVGEGPSSTESATPMTLPSAPRNPEADIDNGLVILNWTAPLDGGGSTITEYYIYRNGTSGVYASVPAGQLGYNDYNVISGLTYTYYVSAANDVGEGPLSNEEDAKAGTVPSSPTGFSASAGDSYVYITWNAPLTNGSYTITNYTIYRGDTLDGETYLTETGNILFYNDTSVTNGVTYYYRVVAINSLGEGSLSDSVDATPLAPVIPINQLPTCAISSPLPDATLKSVFEITGTASDDDGTVLTVEIMIDEDGNWIEVTGTTSWSYQLDTTRLSNGEHNIKVRSYDGENYSSETSTTIEVDNLAPEEEPGFDMTLLLLLIIIIVVILLLIVFLISRKKKPEEEEKPGAGVSKELPPPPPEKGIEEELKEEKEEAGKESEEDKKLPPPPSEEELEGERPSSEDKIGEEETPPPPEEEPEEEMPSPDENIEEEELPPPPEDDSGEEAGLFGENEEKGENLQDDMSEKEDKTPFHEAPDKDDQ